MPRRKKQNQQDQLNPGSTNEVASSASAPEKPDLDKIKEIQDEFSSAGTETKEKAKRYRSKSRAKKEDTEKAKEFAESIGGIGSFLLTLIVERLPNPKPVSSDEMQTFDNLFNKVAYKYSSILGNYQEETALGLVTLMIIAPRIKKIEPKLSNDETKNN